MSVVYVKRVGSNSCGFSVFKNSFFFRFVVAKKVYAPLLSIVPVFLYKLWRCKKVYYHYLTYWYVVVVIILLLLRLFHGNFFV